MQEIATNHLRLSDLKRFAARGLARFDLLEMSLLMTEGSIKLMKRPRHLPGTTTGGELWNGQHLLLKKFV
jgi:hypothetical protein